MYAENSCHGAGEYSAGAGEHLQAQMPGEKLCN